MPSLPETKGTDADSRAWLRRLGAAMIVCALLLGAVIAFCHLGFETNDDIAVLKLAAGLYDGHPGEFLVLMNVIPGLLLKGLYGHVPHVPWYEILLLTVHFLALSLLLFVLFLRRFSWRTLLLFVSFFLTFELVILCRMSYTTTGSLAALAGVLLAVAAFSTEKLLPRTVFAIMGGVLVVAAGLLRGHSFALVLLLAVPLLLGVERRLRLRVWMTIGLASVVTLGLLLYSQRVNVAAGWGDSYELNRCRFALQNFSRLIFNEKTRPYYQEVGWDGQDVDAFRHYFSYDSRVFATTTLTHLADRVPVSRPAGEVIGIIRDNLSYHKFTLLFAAAVVTLVLLRTDRKSRWIMILTAGWSVVMFLGLASTAKPAFRVVHTLILFNAGVAIFLLSAFSRLQTVRERAVSALRRRTEIALVAVLVAGALVQGYRMMKESERTRVRGRQFEEFVSVVRRLGPDAIVVPYSGTPSLPLFVDLDLLNNPRSIPGGCLINSPVYHTVMRNLGMTEVHEALLQRERCYLVVGARTDDHLREHLPPFFKRHYGVDISFQTVARTGDRIIYRLISSSPSGTMP
jgi:hypothetical protein